MTQKPGLIDRTLVLGDLLFATHRDRCCYIGLSARNQLLWQESNGGKWQRIQDVQKEAAPLAPPVDTETKVAAAPAGPNGQTSPRHVQKDGDDKDDVALADTLLGDCSRPCEPTSLPTPVKENAKKQKPPTGISRSTPKLSPELMRIVLNSLRKYPVLWHAASKAGIHRKALEYWIRCSARPIIGVRNTQWEWPSAMQHLGVLEAAGLVRSEPTSGPGIPDAIARALAALVAEELIDHGFDEHRHQRN
jgi:hypothetical protein